MCIRECDIAVSAARAAAEAAKAAEDHKKASATRNRICCDFAALALAKLKLSGSLSLGAGASVASQLAATGDGEYSADYSLEYATNLGEGRTGTGMAQHFWQGRGVTGLAHPGRVLHVGDGV